MPGAVELLREVMTLTSTVSALRNDVDQMRQMLQDHLERIVKLESREEYLMEKMANKAMEGVQRMALPLLGRLVIVEKKVGILPPGDPPKQIE